MPYALVLHCWPQNGPISPADRQGQKALALFLQELIQKQNAPLAAKLHEPRRAKPFTTAILHARGTERTRRSGGFTGVKGSTKGMDEPGGIKIRLTLLQDGLYPLVSQFFLQHMGSVPLLLLGQSPLLVSQMTVTPESGEPWAGFGSFEDLLAQGSEAETTWTMRFATPTSFRSVDADIALPIPRLCFQSWLHSWDEHAPHPFFPDKAERRRFLEEVVEWRVSVADARISPAVQDYYFDGQHVRERGFEGVCRFAVRPSKVAPHHRKILATLVRYSYFCGTGRKTTMGMGVTSPIAL